MNQVATLPISNGDTRVHCNDPDRETADDELTPINTKLTKKTHSIW